ncbi:MAG: hypothetical protein M1819_004772 [Sarea resinae]|nr:MAG: hypothetical protein M1819_004772 [Sarea resinae]
MPKHDTSLPCLQQKRNLESGQTESSPKKSGSVNVGAIAGGVVGGLVVIAILTWLVWWFFIRGRRSEYEEEWTEEDEANEKQTDEWNARRNARASTHTVGSIASTVLTRASNIIQIAYIPGVTNRSEPSSPGFLVPPVPPLPVATSNTNSKASTPNYNQDQHFFMPGDLRDSTYSGLSERDSRHYNGRMSITPSLARSSVATTIYRNNAVVKPMPAQTAQRAKAAMVSVRSGESSTTPPIPSIDYEKLGAKARGSADDQNPPPSPAFSIGSTFLKSTANTARSVTARAVNVGSESNSKTNSQASDLSVSSSTRTTTFGGQRSNRASVAGSSLRHESSAFEAGSDEEEESQPHGDRESKVTVIEDSPAPKQSPFSDDAAASTPRLPRVEPMGLQTITEADDSSSNHSSQHNKTGSLSAVIEEATRRASQQATHGGLGSVPRQRESVQRREPSPFSDDNEVKTS